MSRYYELHGDEFLQHLMSRNVSFRRLVASEIFNTLYIPWFRRRYPREREPTIISFIMAIIIKWVDSHNISKEQGKQTSCQSLYTFPTTRKIKDLGIKYGTRQYTHKT